MMRIADKKLSTRNNKAYYFLSPAGIGLMNAIASINNSGTSFAMQGCGTYDQNCLPQRCFNNQLAKLVRENVRHHLAKNQNCRSRIPFQMADYGCSTGRNSIDLISPALQAVLQCPHSSVHVARCDLPTNDFNQLALNVNATFGRTDRLFESMIPGSFNRQLLPANMVDLGVCSLALHWLEGTSIESDSISPEFSNHESIFELHWRRQLRNFLSHRAVEIKPGGTLFIGHLTKGKNESYKHGPFRLLDDAIELVGIEKPAYCVIPIFRPTHRQLVTCASTDSDEFQVKNDTEVSYRQPLFDPNHPDFDRERLPEQFANFILAFAGPYLRAIINDNSFSLEVLRNAMCVLVRNEPTKYEPRNSYSIVELSIKK